MPAAHLLGFRRRALHLAAAGESVAQIARDLGISESCLRRWVERNRIDSGVKSGPTTDERKELTELPRHNRVLEKEVEIFKRASTYFAWENMLPK